MPLPKKYIYWGLGITLGVTSIALVASHHKHATVNRANGAGASGQTVQATNKKALDFVKPVVSRISSPFGYRVHPVTKQHQFHNGIDLPVPIGTKIKSPADGTVIKIYKNDQGGNQMLIRHTNGYLSGYCHLSKYLVKQGDKVKKGDEVALSGNTGRVTGPHLHLTLKDEKGNWVDPADLIYRA